MNAKISLVIPALLAALAAPAAEESWPQFRGPDGNGLAAGEAPVQWSETSHIKWKSAVPGHGGSSPVVLGDKIWLTSALEENVKEVRIAPLDMKVSDRVTLVALCLDRATGKILWQTTLFTVDKPSPVHQLNTWATPTPVVEPGRLYCDFGQYGTACLEAESGKVLWKKQLPVIDHQVGPGSSPAVWKNLLILVRDGCESQYVAALDKQSGEQVWKTDRPLIDAKRGDLRKAFCTPQVIEVAGRPQLIIPCAHWIVSYEPASGKEIWRIRHGNGFSLAARVLYGHGLIYFCTGFMKAQLMAVKADGQGDVTATHIAWTVDQGIPMMSTPILVGDELYWTNDGGQVSCFDAKTGQKIWRDKLGGKSYMASPLCAGGRLYFFAKEGKTTVIKLGKEFSRLEENQLDGQIMAGPAVVEKAMYLRTDSSLYRIE